jgi:PadR family transcriptional regulator, regulatory protein AphA
MSLRFAILGFLQLAPVSGYDLKKQFNATTNYYWNCHHTQIYRTLKQLLQEGLVEQTLVMQEDHPNKKIYSITNQGEMALSEWLQQPSQLPIIRHEFLLRLSWSYLRTNEELIHQLIMYGEQVQQLLSTYEEQNRQLLREYARNTRELLIWDAILDNGIGYAKHELQWIEQTIEKLKENRE